MQLAEPRCISITETMCLIDKDIFIIDMTVQYRIQFPEGDDLRRCVKFEQDFLPVADQYRRTDDKLLPFAKRFCKHRTDICLSKTYDIGDKHTAISL